MIGFMLPWVYVVLFWGAFGIFIYWGKTTHCTISTTIKVG
jgi:hypothetical protein